MAGGADVRAGRAYVELYVKNSALMKGLKSIRDETSKISQDFLKMGQQVAAVGIAAGIPMAFATKIYADFDDQMRKVKAVSQSTDEQFQQLTSTAKRLGASTSFTAAQAAGLMAELGKAGFTASQIDVMTASVLNLARATDTDAVVASGIMAATIRQFGLQATDAARVADGLTAAANGSFNSVESLGEAMGYAGPVAADMGMSLEETLAILGGLGNVGIQGSMAGTTLKRLSVISAAEAEKLKGIFGVAFTDAAGNVRPLIDVLGEVNAATANMGNAERASKMNEAFGLLGITGASVIGKNIGSIKDLQTAIENAGGVAAKTATEMDGGLGGSFRMMLSAAEGVAIAIGEALAPAFQKIGEYLIPITQVVSVWVSQNKEIVQYAAAGVAALLAFGGSLLAIGSAFGVISFVAGGFISVVTAITTVGAAIIPLIPVALALGAAIGAWYIALQSIPEAGQVAGSAMDTLGGVVGTVTAWIQENFGNIYTTFQETWGGIIEAISAGDLEAAARIALLGLQIIWHENTQTLNKYWLDAKFFFLSTWQEATTMVAGFFTDAYAVIRSGWAETAAFVAQLWDAVSGGNQSLAIEQTRQDALAQIEEERQGAQGALESDNAAAQARLNAEYQAGLDAKKNALAAAKEELAVIRQGVRSKIDGANIAENDPAKYRSGSLDVPTAGAVAATSAVFGTFSAAAAGSLANGPGKRQEGFLQAIQKIQEQQLIEQKKLREKVGEQAVFA